MAQRLLHFLRSSLLALFFPIHGFVSLVGAQKVGINWGMKGSNLPTPSQVISLYHSLNVGHLRLFDPKADVLAALRSSGISVILGTLNEDLSRLSSDPSYAASWVATNIVPYASDIQFRCIGVGNEVIPGKMASYVLPAMRNLKTALDAARIAVPVTTAVDTNVICESHPPSQGRFSDEVATTMKDIAAFLEAANTPLLVNVYPYYAYTRNPTEVDLEYALFRARGVVVKDGSLDYTNLFDAMLDSIYAALEKVGAPNVEVVVSETGWPSGGGHEGATVKNARIYNNNAVAHAANGTGTPKRPGKGVSLYLFAMFNENQKPQGTEQHFGMYQPNMTKVYHVRFPF